MQNSRFVTFAHTPVHHNPCTIVKNLKNFKKMKIFEKSHFPIRQE